MFCNGKTVLVFIICEYYRTLHVKEYEQVFA